MEWKGTAIGDYIGPSTPLNTNEMRKDTFRWEPIDVLIKKRTALQKIPIISGFSNVCGCTQVDDVDSKWFIEHIKKEHNGYIPPLSQINKPPWVGWVIFDSDETELLFCRSKEDLT